ncbi:addiction module component [Pseudomonas gingeri]|uniref:Addiction module component n=1 Tax=Pseudomonas gingeri TaxID=117681 RepID=A0A7Y8C4V5_9PSED|nr:addiction module component [Pseudomonas gingeri]NWC00111.1 addiction module component [Pseudomonas gingeri]
MSLTTFRTPIFDKPDIPVAFEDGLLPLSALNAPVLVTFKVWDNPSTSETYQLLWNDVPIGQSEFIKPGDRPGDTLELYIPLDRLVEGHYQLAYRVTDSFSEAFTDSFPSALEIDTTAPGYPTTLAPLDFPAQVGDGLTSEELTELGDVLPGTIHGYSGFDIGDRIRTFWGDTEGPGGKVEEDDIEPRELTVGFPRAFLESLGDFNGPVFYRVTDRAGNISQDSTAIDVLLLLNGLPLPGDLQRPTIRGASPEAVDNLIDENDFERDASAVITWNPGLREGQNIQLFWAGQPMFDPPYAITEGDVAAARDLHLPVLNSRFRPLGTGSDIRVLYTVTQAGNPNTSRSPEQSIIVRSRDELPGGPEGPDAPLFTELNENGAINTLNGQDGAPVHIAPYLNIKPGDVIHFLYEGFDQLIGGNPKNQWSHISDPLTEEHSRNGYDLRVPRTVLDATCYGHAEATFSVDSLSGTGRSKRQAAYVDMRVAGVCPPAVRQ